MGGCRLVTSTEVTQARLMSLVYDGEGERVLVGTDKNELVLLDIRGNMFRVLKTLSGHSGTVRSLEFVAEAMLLLSGGDRTCVAWNMCKRGQAVSRCRPLAAFRGGPQSSVRSVMYCRSQKEVLSGCDNGMIAVWNTKSATVKLVLHAHNAEVTFMRWLGDNQFLTASRDGTIKVCVTSMFYSLLMLSVRHSSGAGLEAKRASYKEQHLPTTARVTMRRRIAC